MFIQSSIPAPKQTTDKNSNKEGHAIENKSSKFSFNIKRMLIAAGFLIFLLIFAIGTAFSVQLNEIHSMLVHSFELVLGLFAGLLGGEAIAKSEG